MRIRSVAVLAAALAAAAQAAAFPMQLELHNNNWQPAVEPETSAHLGPYGSAVVTVKDRDQLMRMVANIEALNEIGGKVEDAGLSIEVDLGPSAEQVEADRLAAEQAEAERKAAEQAAAAAAKGSDGGGKKK